MNEDMENVAYMAVKDWQVRVRILILKGIGVCLKSTAILGLFFTKVEGGIPQYRSYYTLGRGACWLRPAVPKV